MREVPLLISVFYIKNPIYFIIASAITALGTPAEGSYISSVIMHTGALIAIGFFYSFLNKKNLNRIAFSVSWLAISVIYYVVFLLPLLMIFYYIFGVTEEVSLNNLGKLIYAVRSEIIVSSVISAIFLLQHKTMLLLRQHKETLEIKVQERTGELSAINEELTAANEELSIQKKEIQTTMEKLEATQEQMI